MPITETKIVNFNKDSNLIFLIGFMGSGKSTVGPLLAKRLSYKFLDTDDIIEGLTDSTIADLWLNYGERHFRGMETQVVKMLSQRKNLVIACGGGLPCNNDNMSRILALGKVIYLDVHASTLFKRLESQYSKRPLLAADPKALFGKIESELIKRQDCYQHANHIIGNNEDADRCLKVILDQL